MGTRKKMAIGGGTIGPGIGMPDFDPIRDGALSSQTNTDAGNAPYTQIYGQRRSTPFSLDEYLSGSMYDFAGINVSAAPDVDDDGDDEDDEVTSSVLTPVSERTDDPTQVFRGVSFETGQYGTNYGVANLDPGDYLKKILNEETFTINEKDDSFSKYAKQKLIDDGMIALAPAGLALGPMSVLGAAAASYAKKFHKSNAETMMQSGGGAGDFFTLNGATVSRAPGEKVFTGNIGNFSHSQMYAAREMDFGFIPGSMKETVTQAQIGAGPQGLPRASRTGLGGVEAAGSVPGHIMDAFGTVHGVRDSDTGSMNVSAGAAQRLRETEFRNMMAEQGIDVTKQFTDGKGNFSKAAFTRAAVEYKQFVDGKMKTHPSYGGFFHKTSNLSSNAYASAMAFRVTTAGNYIKDKYGITTTPVKTGGDGGPPPGPAPKVPPPPVRDSAFDSGSIGDLGFDDSDGGRYDSDDDGGSGGGTQYSVQDIEDDIMDSFGGSEDAADYSFDFGFKRGGRVGMQAGGAAQRPLPEAGFVAGPPENFTERETVADDQNGSVAEGTFVINAAAVEYAGSEDIRKMILDAYSKAREKGLDIGRVDRKLYEGTVDVALSKGEVVVPPELAKIIGYDRLEKINNRGKKEVSRRQKKAGGGFLDGKKYAKGDKVTVYRGEPLDPAKNQGVRTDYGYDQKYVGTHHTPDLRRAQGYANYGNQPGNRVIRSMKVTADEFFDGMQELIVTNNQKARNNKSRMPVSKKLDDDFSRFIESMRNRVLTGQTSLDEITRNMIMNEAVFPNKKSKINFVETYKNDPKSAGKLVAKTISKLGRKAVPVIGAIETAYGMLAPSPLGDATLNPNIRFDDD